MLRVWRTFSCWWSFFFREISSRPSACTATSLWARAASARLTRSPPPSVTSETRYWSRLVKRSISKWLDLACAVSLSKSLSVRFVILCWLTRWSVMCNLTGQKKTFHSLSHHLTWKRFPAHFSLSCELFHSLFNTKGLHFNQMAVKVK